jgi:CubicO group peptidase (beta-lactamase class C family)
MKSNFTLCLLLVTFFVTAQKKDLNYKFFFEKFSKRFNTNQFQEITELLSSEMTSSPDKMISAMQTLRSSLGEIDNYKLIKLNEDNSTLFKVYFDYAVMGMEFSLDEYNKLLKLKIRPFKDFENDALKNPVFNNLVSKDDAVSKSSLDYIYEYSKYFPNNSELAIAIIQNGKINYYGLTKLKDTISCSNNSESQFEIGSITKVFTSTLLAEMVVENKLKLEEDIFNYLDIDDKEKITFLSLANHTSGLPRLPTNLDLSKVDNENPYKMYDENCLLTYLNDDLKFSPDRNQTYEYSNLGAGLLGFTLSKIENSTLEDLFNLKIFSKFGMDASTIEKQKAKNLVKGRNKNGEVTKNWDMSSLSGAGAIISNVEDLSKFVLAHFDSNNKGLTLTREKTAEATSNMDIGLGWHLRQSSTNKKWMWHNGGTGGYTSSITFNPKTKNAVIILSNVSAFHSKMSNIDRLNFSLMEIIEAN